MNHAGIVAPFESLRWPVSISWLISTRTSTLSPAIVARIFIGSVIIFSRSDEPRGDRRAFRVLALARFHLVAHQHTDFYLVAGHRGADFHRICHHFLQIG